MTVTSILVKPVWNIPKDFIPYLKIVANMNEQSFCAATENNCSKGTSRRRLVLLEKQETKCYGKSKRLVEDLKIFA